MKKLILVALSTIALLAMVLTIASPVLACTAGKSPGYYKNHTSYPGVWRLNPSATLGQTFPALNDPDYNKSGVTLLAALDTGKNSALFGRPEAMFLRAVIVSMLNDEPQYDSYFRSLIASAWDGTNFRSSFGNGIEYFIYPNRAAAGVGPLTMEQWKNSLESWFVY
jgi:hypothetical protein